MENPETSVEPARLPAGSFSLNVVMMLVVMPLFIAVAVIMGTGRQMLDALNSSASSDYSQIGTFIGAFMLTWLVTFAFIVFPFVLRWLLKRVVALFA